MGNYIWGFIDVLVCIMFTFSLFYLKEIMLNNSIKIKDILAYLRLQSHMVSLLVSLLAPCPGVRPSSVSLTTIFKNLLQNHAVNQSQSLYR